ncbi:MAG: hypothetical protein ACI9XP_001001 [Lentimonas sp.]|jgi:hypothetical protein
MVKKRSIISYEDLNELQKKALRREYPEGYLQNLTQIKTPLGEMMDALIWERDETIYVVKFAKALRLSMEDDEDDMDDFDAEIESGDKDDAEANSDEGD